MLIAIGLLLIIALTALTGYFVAQEFGYVAVNRGQLARAAESGDRRAARALRVTGRLSFMLSGAQLGITVTALLVGYVAEPYLGRGLAQLFGASGLTEGVSAGLAVAIALAVSTIVQMVLGELAPKNFAIARSFGLARALSASTVGYLTVAGPIIRLFDSAANRMLRRVGVEPAEELEPGATLEDLEHIVADSQEQGRIDRQLSIMLDRGLSFRRRTAGGAMTVRVDVIIIHSDEPCTRVVELLGTGRSRFPVIGSDGVDDIVGVVSISDLLAVPVPDRASTPVRTVARPALFVPTGLPLRAVLEELRRAHRQLACVIDEYGGFAGVVSLEDVAEELVGPIQDEDDLPEPVPRRQPDGTWVVPASWRVDEVVDATDLALPESGEYDTLSGLVLAALGRVPSVGDTVVVHGEIEARVLSVRRHVADTVQLRARAPRAEAEPGEER